MDELVSVASMQEQLLNMSNPLAALDLPLLDAHGASLASDLLVDEKLVIKSGQRIDSTQIALAASLGLDRLPCRPQPRVVIISAGDDLVEPGSKLADAEDEYESNSCQFSLRRTVTSTNTGPGWASASASRRCRSARSRMATPLTPNASARAGKSGMPPVISEAE